MIQANLNYVRVPKYSESAGWHNTRSEARFRCLEAGSGAWLGQPRPDERYLELFQFCVRCSMIEQESHGADNPSRVPTARQACYESVAASTAMLVRTLSGRPLALPLWHRVRAVWMPTLGSAAPVATAVLPARPRELIYNYLELGPELREQVVVLSSDSEVRDLRRDRQGRRAPAPRHVRVRPGGGEWHHSRYGS